MKKQRLTQSGLIWGKYQLILTFLLLPESTPDFAAVAEEGSSTAGFAVLCRIINLAKQTPPPPNLLPSVDDVEETMALVNLTLAAPAAAKELATAADPTAALKSGSDQTKIHCAEAAAAPCTEAATRLRGHKDSVEFRALLEAATDPTLFHAINTTLQDMVHKLSELKQQQAAAQAEAVSGKLTQALGAEPDGASTIKLTGATGNGATSCGKPDSDAAGTAVGKTIACDVVCMCASDSINNNNKACAEAAETATVKFSTEAEIKSQWKTLGDACKNQQASEKLTSTALRAFLAAFNVTINTGQGTNSNLTGVLGLIQGGATTGCEGSNTGPAGSCVFHGRNPTTKAVKPPEWLAPLTTAADELEAAKRAASHAHASSAQLQSLNTTITSLILLGSSTKKQQAAATQKPTENNNVGKTEQEAVSRECAQHKNNKTACDAADKCKWKGKSETDGAAETNTECKNFSEKKAKAE
uniref:Variant surface glycoprotein 1125.1153 n=1 Tax=Trypanosoma brucei TaxID=5691 RepID=A0A1J0R6C7_9TRYP|nr:variant surface glycoprotein 1125.1153 [Trypanosoma brucei]